jgi:uncharacterized protein YbjT (DUF2867 family)
MLARELRARGKAVRATTRDCTRLHELEDAGAEAVLADPDRVATLVPALEHVGVAVILLGSARGEADQLRALHGTRLEMLLHKMIDTTVRGIVYEAVGSVDPEILQAGAERVRAYCEDSRIPFVLLAADPGPHPVWLEAARDAVEAVLASAQAS